jgi:hypothetical protein
MPLAPTLWRPPTAAAAAGTCTARPRAACMLRPRTDRNPLSRCREMRAGGRRGSSRVWPPVRAMGLKRECGGSVLAARGGTGRRVHAWARPRGSRRRARAAGGADCQRRARRHRRRGAAPPGRGLPCHRIGAPPRSRALRGRPGPSRGVALRGVVSAPGSGDPRAAPVFAKTRGLKRRVTPFATRGGAAGRRGRAPAAGRASRARARARPVGLRAAPHCPAPHFQVVCSLISALPRTGSPIPSPARRAGSNLRHHVARVLDARFLGVQAAGRVPGQPHDRRRQCQEVEREWGGGRGWGRSRWRPRVPRARPHAPGARQGPYNRD